MDRYSFEKTSPLLYLRGYDHAWICTERPPPNYSNSTLLSALNLFLYIDPQPPPNPYVYFRHFRRVDDTLVSPGWSSCPRRPSSRGLSALWGLRVVRVELIRQVPRMPIFRMAIYSRCRFLNRYEPKLCLIIIGRWFIRRYYRIEFWGFELCVEMIGLYVNLWKNCVVFSLELFSECGVWCWLMWIILSMSNFTFSIVRISMYEGSFWREYKRVVNKKYSYTVSYTILNFHMI